jgi:hypothetical protein
MSFHENISYLKELIVKSDKQFYIFSKLTYDALISSAIIIKVLKNLDRNFSINFFSQINENKIREISNIPNALVLGLSQNELELIPSKLLTLNDSEKSEIELSYLLALEFNPKNESLAYLTLLSNSSFKQGNLEVAKTLRQVSTARGTTLIGSNTQPLYKTIEMSVDPFILNFSGSEERSMNLLRDLNISIKMPEKFTSIVDLNSNDLDRLLKALNIQSRNTEEIILINSEEPNSPLKDINEFKLFLECCILFNNPSLAICKLLANKDYRTRANEVVKEYRRNIIQGLSLFYTKSEQVQVSQTETLTIINFNNNLFQSKVLEKITSSIQRSELYPQKARIVTLARTQNDLTKCVIYSNNYDLDNLLKNFINNKPSSIVLEKASKNTISLLCELNEENNLISMILANLEGVRIEQIEE